MFKTVFFALFALVLFQSSEKVSTIGLKELKNKVLHPQNDTLYVVNFWATWCKPCVKEMPYFEAINRQFSPQKVKVIFVSLNSPKESKQINKFVSEHNISAETYLLDAGNPNVWIDQIEPEWSGSIPATILYKNGEKIAFAEHDFEQHELDSLIHTKIK